jgi:hypothetical protein
MCGSVRVMAKHVQRIYINTNVCKDIHTYIQIECT